MWPSLSTMAVMLSLKPAISLPLAGTMIFWFRSPLETAVQTRAASTTRARSHTFSSSMESPLSLIAGMAGPGGSRSIKTGSLSTAAVFSPVGVGDAPVVADVDEGGYIQHLPHVGQETWKVPPAPVVVVTVGLGDRLLAFLL